MAIVLRHNVSRDEIESTGTELSLICATFKLVRILFVVLTSSSMLGGSEAEEVMRRVEEWMKVSVSRDKIVKEATCRRD